MDGLLDTSVVIELFKGNQKVSVQGSDVKGPETSNEGPPHSFHCHSPQATLYSCEDDFERFNEYGLKVKALGR